MPWWQAKMSGYVGLVVKWHDVWRNTRTRRSKWSMIAQRKWMRPWGKWVHQWPILSLRSALECCANHRAFSFTWRLGSPTFDAASLRGRERLWRLKSSGRRSITICTFCVREHPHEFRTWVRTRLWRSCKNQASDFLRCELEFFQGQHTFPETQSAQKHSTSFRPREGH